MMKSVLLLLVAFTFAQAGHALGASITDTPWDQGSIETLRTYDKASVAGFLTGVIGNFSGHGDCSCVKPKDIDEYTWADLQGDGKFELVASMDVNGRAFFDALLIFWRDASGKMIYQEVRGGRILDLGRVVRDLNGDGKKELVIPIELVSHSSAGAAIWPAVYRLEKGKYVEASGDFPGFYEDEALPKLKSKIENTRRTMTRVGTSETPLDLEYRQSLQGKLADLITERNKILRLIGRDPTAGLQDAREWMKSNDPDLLQDAAVTLKDISGHEDEARAASEAYQRTARDAYQAHSAVNH
jgi:hypothetical protein